eukprot:TRINITY_DN9933_c0_g1_i1.p1 TRINITY_DN9933_c0_g1~~TRINITY_DN9933_c0_g1_i1.p1  ORF type:complete len:283 (-),score=53.43 TRINITY_DN9933_c0_g1_i1:34-783(-)
MWNAMITPILPMKITGVIWYQGEANTWLPYDYCCAIVSMINDWRNYWQIGNFPFIYVQLPPYTFEAPVFPLLPEFRDKQDCALRLPNVGVAIAIDGGDYDSPYGNVHPRNKQIIGERLAAVARKIVYNEPVPYMGPTPKDAWIIDGVGPIQIAVDFNPSTVGSTLKLKPNDCPLPEEEQKNCGWFEINLFGTWHRASVILCDGTTLCLFLYGKSGSPSQVRYGYATWPVATLYNSWDFPAAPFYLNVTG